MSQGIASECWVGALLAVLVGCSDPAPPGTADAAAAEVSAPTDVVTTTDLSVPTDAPLDRAVPGDALDAPPVDTPSPDGADAAVTPDAEPMDAGAPEALGVRGAFVGGGVAGSGAGIMLTGHFSWHASVSGSSGGITLEGFLR